MSNPESPTFLHALSYDATATLAATDANLWPVVFWCAISFLGAYMQYFGAIKNGFRDKTHAIPVGCNLWFFAHDTTFVMNFSHWFYTVDHWLMKAFWVMLVLFALLEATVIYQVLRYSRHKVFPGLTLPQAVGVYLLCQIAAYIAFWWFHQIIEDPLYLLSFTTTVILTPVLTIPLMLQRNSQQGFSPFMLWGYVFLAVGFYPWMYLVDPYFTSPLFVSLGVANIAIALVTLWMYYRLPRFQLSSEQV
ncbi:hypothetical protein HBA55_04580 [Pseudomaricurvus alkylphenolicus]|uniref:hypothetical protein n=1 Tax=Pseudomaricurvus alkylphenolicus TaxID=1306991 RepID=UPI00141DCD4F|nr:hypothetical protein [Pseudomaricurvus alkylphenolicus]NIB38848.1 hypothetical protein [Pseudomaricurvus alkylphenolicus]